MKVRIKQILAVAKSSIIVTPPKLKHPSGLKSATRTENRTQNIKKFRKVAPPPNIFFYLLKILSITLHTLSQNTQFYSMDILSISSYAKRYWKSKMQNPLYLYNLAFVYQKQTQQFCAGSIILHFHLTGLLSFYNIM